MGSYEFEFNLFVSKDRVVGVTSKVNGQKFMRFIEKINNVKYAKTSFKELKLVEEVLPYYYNIEIVRKVNRMLSDLGVKKVNYWFPSNVAPLFIFTDSYCITIAPIIRG